MATVMLQCRLPPHRVLRSVQGSAPNDLGLAAMPVYRLNRLDPAVMEDHGRRPLRLPAEGHDAIGEPDAPSDHTCTRDSCFVLVALQHERPRLSGHHCATAAVTGHSMRSSREMCQRLSASIPRRTVAPSTPVT